MVGSADASRDTGSRGSLRHTTSTHLLLGPCHCSGKIPSRLGIETPKLPSLLHYESTKPRFVIMCASLLPLHLHSTLLISNASMPVRIDLRASKFPCTDSLLKQHVELTVRSALRFWQSKVHPHHNAAAGTSPEKCRFRTPSPVGIPELIVCQHVDDDVGNVVQCSSEHNCFRFQSCGRHFRDDRVGYWANREVVYEDEENQHRSDSPIRGLGAGKGA